MSQVFEATIRDELAQRLSVLEPGLSLLDIEHYVPNPSGTRGFIDLLAKDTRGRHVLIELKRSDAAARQAIHEVFKYIEGIKANIALRDDELRVLIVSTEWAELLVPFSSLVSHVAFDVEGYALRVDVNGVPVSAERVEPVPIREDRLFTQWHEVSLYTSAESMKRGIQSYESACERKGIENFVLVDLTAPEDHRERELTTVHAALNAMRPANDQLSMDEVAEKVPEHTHMLYFSMLQLPNEVCLERIRGTLSAVDREEELEEFEEVIAGISGEELSGTLQERLLDLDPRPHRDYLEIGYPAKFGAKILDDEGWHIDRVLRYGSLRHNALLSDDTIIAEIRGEQGVTRQRYVREFQGPPSAGQLNSVREEVRRCLEDNPIWNMQVQVALNDLLEVDADSRSRMSVFNPSNALLSIYHAISREDGALYVPSYHITTISPRTKQMTYGVFSGSNIRPSMTRLLANHFSGSVFGLLFPLTWGGYLANDRFVARDAGLTYRTFKAVDDEDGVRTGYELTELGWEPRGEVPLPFSLFEQYLNANEDFVADVYDIFATHWNGAMFTTGRDEALSLRT